MDKYVVWNGKLYEGLTQAQKYSLGQEIKLFREIQIQLREHFALETGQQQQHRDKTGKEPVLALFQMEQRETRKNFS